ncbi:sorting nexin-32-like isoform X2 [Tachypleus tridentatus]|uniref:sorting nexin-32-like isoform X2 n=1 Tax=Tachypleus tridentatus TaxID=6853 RepID=UPI003FCF5BCB
MMESTKTGDSDSGHNGDLYISQAESEVDRDSPTLETVSGFSTSSSPLPPEPFEPHFWVKFTGEVTKNGDVVKYTIKTWRRNDERTEFVVERQYEDIEWLEHCLITSNPIPGLIIPPLPPKPAITSEMAEIKSKKQLGSDTRTLIGDEFDKDCRHLEHYLKLLVSHHVFGKDEALEKFLTEKEPPPRAKVKKGIFSWLSDSIESRKGSHKDCEEYFQKERDWANQYSAYMKEASQAFNGIIYAQQRLSGVLGHLATTLTLSTGSNDEVNKLTHRLCTKFSECLEEVKNGLEEISYSDDSTLGDYFELYTRYLEAEKEMLFRRTCLLVAYENSNKALDKAKPNKRDAAEEAKLLAEKSFEECTDIARQEMKYFHRQRAAIFQDRLVRFTEEQVRCRKDLCMVLTKYLTNVKEFQAPCSEE